MNKNDIELRIEEIKNEKEINNEEINNLEKKLMECESFFDNNKNINKIRLILVLCGLSLPAFMVLTFVLPLPLPIIMLIMTGTPVLGIGMVANNFKKMRKRNNVDCKIFSINTVENSKEEVRLNIEKENIHIRNMILEKEESELRNFNDLNDSIDFTNKLNENNFVENIIEKSDIDITKNVLIKEWFKEPNYNEMPIALSIALLNLATYGLSIYICTGYMFDIIIPISKYSQIIFLTSLGVFGAVNIAYAKFVDINLNNRKKAVDDIIVENSFSDTYEKIKELEPMKIQMKYVLEKIDNKMIDNINSLIYECYVEKDTNISETYTEINNENTILEQSIENEKGYVLTKKINPYNSRKNFLK